MLLLVTFSTVQAAQQELLAACWEQTGTDHIQIMLTSKKLLVNVTNYGADSASAKLKISCAGKVGLYPTDQTVNVAAGETKTAHFSISNLGVEEQVDNIPITITLYEAYDMSEISSKTVYATLLATLGQGQTTLKVSAVEKGTDKPAVVQLTVLYPANGQGEEETKWTKPNGEADLPFKVGYNGDIKIQVAESDDYFAEDITSAVHFGSNPLTIEVTPKNPQPETTTDLTLPAAVATVVIVATIVIAVGVLVLRKKH